MHEDRREFLRHASAALAAAAVIGPAALARSARRSDALNVVVIGCGGRGSGAVVDMLAADPAAKLVGMADVFRDRIDGSRRHLAQLGDRAQAPDDHCFAGFDAAERVLALPGVDVALLCTPPHFRPAHFELAVRAGCHVFLEKPVAVDAPGVRRVMTAAEEAQKRGLNVVAGTQRRHEPSYLAAMEQVRGGAIGSLVAGRAFWNQGGLWVRDRTESMCDMEWHLRNWLYFTWVSGDHIVEQHVHNLDVLNWAFGAHPVRAVGTGGRQVRTEAKFGHVYDHFAVDLEYPGGRCGLSMCRQQDRTASRVEEVLHGSDGVMTLRPGHAVIEGERPWRWSGTNENPYVREQRALVRGIRSGDPADRINEGRQVAESTLTAILAREVCYTGRSITWEEMLADERSLAPPAYAFGALPPVRVAMPGQT